MDRRPIPEYPGYAADNEGNIWSFWKKKQLGYHKGCASFISAHPRILSPRIDQRGRKDVVLCRGGERRHWFVHQLVLLAFVGPCPQGMEGCHNNGNASDCSRLNLRWDTPKNNHADKQRHGTTARGERHGRSKLTNKNVHGIREQYDSGEFQAVIAARFGVSQTVVSQIIRRKIWAHV